MEVRRDYMVGDIVAVRGLVADGPVEVVGFTNLGNVRLRCDDGLIQVEHPAMICGLIQRAATMANLEDVWA